MRIQSKLDKGKSVNSIAKEEGVAESAIRYGLKQGYKKKRTVTSFSPNIYKSIKVPKLLYWDKTLTWNYANKKQN
jgi:hypothetical protein